MKYRIITNGEIYRIQSWVWYWPFWSHCGYSDYGNKISYYSIDAAKDELKKWIKADKARIAKSKEKWLVAISDAINDTMMWPK